MAYVLSSVSGNLISAASAGFAPTNSADVSAIASSYQVVSATATQLYAGTAYVTSVNDNPLSASRAGNAANASMANSAYYDGTGRIISALPDSATVSAIASSYAESAASSKQDALTFGYNTADQISSIDGSALGGMDEAAVSAIASAYAESAASSKQDTLTFGYNAEDKISSINGSSLAGEGGGGGLVTAIGTSESGITSINNSGLVDTAALRSADYSSLYVQEPLYISASGDSSYIGISGDVGGVDSATCSAIASAYAESAASSKLDTTAFNSGDFYTTANPSGFIDSAYVDSAVSSKADSSALSSYVPYSSLEYNTASAISGINGSALAAGSTYSAGEGIDITDDVISVEAPVDIVAGPGIVIDNPDGNTLRVSVAQNVNKVLWTGSMWDSNRVANLEEPASNFEYVLLYGYAHEAPSRGCAQVFPISGNSYASLNCGNLWYSDYLCYNASSTVLNLSGHNHAWVNGSTVTTGSDGLVITKIVGCARTASAQ